MEEKTKEQIEQEELAMWDQVGEEVFDTGSKADPVEDTPEETPIKSEEEDQAPQEKLSPELQEMINGLTKRVADQDVLLNRLKQAEQRIGSLTNKLRDANIAASQSKDAPSVEEIRKAIESQKEWEELKDEFPEWGKKVDKRFSDTEQNFKKELEDIKSKIPDLVKLRGELTEEVRNEFAAAKKKKEEEQLNVDREILRTAYPGYSEIVRTPEFNEWLSKQPKRIHVMYSGFDLKDALYIMEKYHDNKGSQQSKRDRLEAAISAPRGTTPRSKNIVDMDEAEAWNHAAKSIWKK